MKLMNNTFKLAAASLLLATAGASANVSTTVSAVSDYSFNGVSQTDSGHTSSMAHADLLIVQPEHDPGQSTGTIVEAIVVDAF